MPVGNWQAGEHQWRHEEEEEPDDRWHPAREEERIERRPPEAMAGGGSRGGSRGGRGPGILDEWEPGDDKDWAERDPLGSKAGRWPEGESCLYEAKALYQGWRRLPEPLRAQAWRERQISAEIFRRSEEGKWTEKLPGLQMLGVGRRPWEKTGLPGTAEAARWGFDLSAEYKAYLQLLGEGNYASAMQALGKVRRGTRDLLSQDPLAAVLTVRPPLPPLPEMFALLGINPLLNLPGGDLPLDFYGLSPLVPVIFEASPPVELFSNPAVVGPSSSTLIPLQSGMEVSGLKKGTLGALVKRPGDASDYLLGAQHVLGDVNDNVYFNGSLVGKVIASNSDMDASLVELHSGFDPRPEILGLNLIPTRPCLHTNGLEVEFCGATSQVQGGKTTQSNLIPTSGSAQLLGNVTQVNMAPATLYSQSQPLLTEITANAQKGDSGALVLISRNQPGFPSGILRQNPALGNQYPVTAILGILLAGTVGSHYPAIIYASHALQLGVALNIEWRTKP